MPAHLNGALTDAALLPPRLLCHDAEQYALGAGLVSRKACLRLLEELDALDFDYLPHQLIFAAMRSHHGREPETRVEAYTVKRELTALGTLEGSGGELYLLELINVADTGGLDQYLRDIKRFSGLRFLREAFEEGLAEVRPEADPETIISQFTTLLLARKSAERGQPVTLAAAGREELARIQRREVVPTLKYGIASIDKVAAGIGGGEMGFLGARPGAGKTALALRLLMHGALAWGPMLFISLEMKEASVVRREFAHLCGLTYQELRELRHRTGQEFSAADVARIERKLAAFWPAAEQVWIDTHSHQLSQLVTRCHRMALAQGIRAMVLDYGQLVQDDRGRRQQSKTEEVMRVVRALKSEIAMPLNIPVLCIAAVSREVEKRSQGRGEEKKPALLQMSDLGWSSELEAVAEQIIFLNPHPDLCGADTDTKRHLLLGVEKNRNGGKGAVPLIFNAPTFSFEELATQSDDDAPPDRRFV